MDLLRGLVQGWQMVAPLPVGLLVLAKGVRLVVKHRKDLEVSAISAILSYIPVSWVVQKRSADS